MLEKYSLKFKVVLGLTIICLAIGALSIFVSAFMVGADFDFAIALSQFGMFMLLMWFFGVVALVIISEKEAK